MTEFISRLEKTRKKLLDLTKRNKLINYKRPSKSRKLNIIDESAQFIYKNLVHDANSFKFKPIPEPEPLLLENKKLLLKKEKLENLKNQSNYVGEVSAAEQQLENISERLQSNEANVLLTAEERAQQLGFRTSNELPDIDLTLEDVDEKYIDEYLQTLHYPGDLEKIVKKIELESRNIIQETGTNMLYLILGLLEWTESNNSDVKLKSPLISIPVTIKRGALNKETNTYEYILEYNGDGLDTNKSLAEKLYNDFNILLPELNEDMSFTEYMQEVSKLLKTQKNWRIKQEISLDFLNFAKILMYKDLDDSNWEDGASLSDNPILNDLFIGTETDAPLYAPTEYDIDSHPIAQKIPLVMDADSSQHSAIVDVLKGENIVIEGPPGTGKSQTISNMIAALLAEGKSVLFVSEKLAALEVVHKRLSAVGLEDFCLELHSHKTQKVKILDSFAKRISGHYAEPANMQIVTEKLMEKRKDLQKHLDVLHSKFGESGKTIFDIFWIVEKYHDVSKYIKFEMNEPSSYTTSQVTSSVEQLTKYQSFVNNYDFKDFYWYGFNLDKLNYIDIDMFILKLNKLNETYKTLSKNYKDLSAITGCIIDNETLQSKEIESFLNTSILNVKDVTNKVFLEACLDDGVKVFEKYLSLFMRINSIYEKNKLSIVEYISLNRVDKQLISNFDNKLTQEIQNLYVKRKKDYDTIYASIDHLYPGIANTLESDTAYEISNEISAISDFLYDDASIDDLKNIYAINDKVSSNVSNFDSLLKTLCRQIGYSFNNEVFEIDAIIKAASLLQQIDPMIYINMQDSTGTVKFDGILDKAQNDHARVTSLSLKSEEYYSLSQVTKNIEELQEIRQIIQDKKDSFFSMFSSQFNKAKKELTGLLKDGLPSEKALWIPRIDNLIAYLSAKQSFEQNTEYKEYFQDLFNGVNTHWDKINTLNTWAKKVKQDVKINTIAQLLLDGNEQTQITFTSSLEDINNEMETFIQHLQSMKEIYLEHFYKTFYTNFEDINIIKLQETCNYINNQLNSYIPNISKYIKDTSEQLSNASYSFKNFNIAQKVYFDGKEQVELHISKLHSQSQSDATLKVEIDKLLSLFFIQNDNVQHIVDMIKDEITNLSELESVEKIITDDIGIGLEKSKEESLLIDKSIHSFYEISKSNLSKNIQIFLMSNFNKTFEILHQISDSKNSLQGLLQELNQYGEIDQSFFPLSNSYIDYSLKLDLMDEHIEDLSVWLDYRHLIVTLENLNISEIVIGVESDKLPKDKITSAFYYNFYFSLLREAFRSYPLLNQFSRLSHEQVVEAFKSLDLELMEINRAHVAAKASNKNVPYGISGGSVKDLTEQKLIEHEISKKTRHIPIRQLVRRAGKAMKELKPCFMMSPLSVAQYLPPSKMSFDVLIVDEASQLRPEEALGVIARAKQIVIVGDPKQLPPTSFFDAIKEDNDEEETVVDESESILDTCIDLYKPIRRLRWHYRSQHESLIDFSNQRFYENDLIVFPSPTHITDDEMGIKHTYIQNSLYQGRVNKLEAKIVVEHIEMQMKNFPGKSLGVGTFNTTQRDLIQQMIDEKEKVNIFVENYINRWQNSSEPFFIKNLESLQGDERDVIYISTTYGPDKVSGKVFQRFGPINQATGWRRLNVLITRSKQKMHVFTSMQSTDIIIGETSSRGVQALRGFLQYVETGKLTFTPEIIDGKGFDSPFEESVYTILSDAGIKSVPQVGVAGYFIDLAVVSDVSDDFVLAIECDGATYHSSKSARDRDRLKQEVLERIGWKVYRIWSTDWFKNRDHEVSKLLQVAREQLSVYAEQYKHRRTVSPAHQNVTVEKLEESKDHAFVQANLFDEIIEEKTSQIHGEETLQHDTYTQNFVSDEKIKDLLNQLLQETVSKEFTIDKRSILSPLMIDQFVKYKPLNMDEFRNKIPMRLRTNINPEQLIYMPEIFDIIEMSDE